ncbi:efflux RND transporter permease subunit [Candidatus Contubernalis alkaliaceticus]|uniref:efflux RND transporter permease subunit n=1 Tax=Candidatus Contubernalis alkaliaceticus TaxID=338645 RepID=UPI001F4C2AE8|nr:efflux RND transporter permease subunit [Candidatus Contubernalis alkalaceticus]UNC93234.1 MMPL family transporter [Candidatus Contubernalis alkalaceticus]
MFKTLSKTIVERYKLVLIISAVAFVISILMAMNVGMDSSMEGMLPEGSRSLQASREFEEYFESQDNVLVVVQGEKHESEGFIDELGDKLQSKDIISSILYKVDMAEIKDYLHLYIDKGHYEGLEKEINDRTSALSQFMEEKEFVTLSALFLQRFDDLPEGNREAFLNSFAKFVVSPEDLTDKEREQLFSVMLFGYTADREEDAGYIVSDSGDTYLMMIKPNINSEDFVEDRALYFNTLEDSIVQVKDSGGYEVSVGYTGGAFVQDYEADETMFDGFLSTAAITFILIILFIILSFKRLLLPVSAGYPLLLGAVLATAFAWLVYKNLNMFSISFAILLLGLGIDFGVHIISRYLEEREGGLDVSAAVATTVRETSSGIFVAAITTAIAFFTFLMAEFTAFTQMGVISGGGIILLCVTMIFVMPSIILLFDLKGGSQKQLKGSGYEFLKPVGRAVEQKPLVFVVIFAIAAVILAGNVFNTNIKTDISEIYPEDMECLQWLDVVEDEFAFNPTTLVFMVDDMDELERVSEELSSRDDIRQLESVLNYMPEEQDYKVSVIKKLNTGLRIKPQNGKSVTQEELLFAFGGIINFLAERGIDESAEGYRLMENARTAFLTEGNNESTEAVETTDNNTESSRGASGFYSVTADIENLLLNEKKFTYDKLPHDIKANYAGKDGKLSVEVVPDVNVWDSENYQNIAEAIYDVSGRTPVGMPAIMNEVTEYAKSDVVRISLFCLGTLFIILWLMFKSMKDAIIVIIPLVLMIYMTLGIAPIIFGDDLNIFSIIAFPVLVGIGVDSGVHLLHRIKHSEDKDLSHILAYTGKAIVMTTITTLIGFGSLYFINHPGLSSFGLVTIVGMALCLMLTLILVPSLYLLFNKKGRNEGTV